MADLDIDEQVREKFTSAGQRYSTGRAAIVHALMKVGQPASVPKLLATSNELKQSSIYRNLSVLVDIGVVNKIALGDSYLFELSEDLVGHHHHLRCLSCGQVVDVDLSSGLEDAVTNEGRKMAKAHGYELVSHQIDFFGVCPACHELA